MSRRGRTKKLLIEDIDNRRPKPAEMISISNTSSYELAGPIEMNKVVDIVESSLKRVRRPSWLFIVPVLHWVRCRAPLYSCRRLPLQSEETAPMLRPFRQLH